MSKLSDILVAGMKAAFLVVRIPGLLIAANRRYRQFSQGFLEETAAMGIPADAAMEMVDGLKPGHLYRGFRQTRLEKQPQAYTERLDVKSG